MNVLVVDDDREIVDSICIFLSAEGYKALKAYDGIEVLDILSENEVHLMILDVMMPRLDGIKTLMKLRESRNIPVILLSAKSEDTDKIFGLTARTITSQSPLIRPSLWRECARNCEDTRLSALSESKTVK